MNNFNNNDQSEIIEVSLMQINFKGDNDFLIGKFLDKNNNTITGLGNIINVQIGVSYILTGVSETHSKFGEQFKFHSYETIMPVDTNGIFKYLVRICKFVGMVTGDALINKYGNDTLKVLKTDPQQVSLDIPRINIDRAKEIQHSLLENERNEKVMIKLEAMLDVPGMWKSLPRELIKKYGDKAAEIVEFNPYILTQFRGIGFPLADMVALKTGIKRNDIERKKACIFYCIEQEMGNTGSVWIQREKLMQMCKELIQVPKMEQGLIALEDEGVIDVEETAYSLFFSSDDEFLISKKIAELIHGGSL